MNRLFLTTLLTLLFSYQAYGIEKKDPAKYNYCYQKHEKETIGSVVTNGTVSLLGTHVLGIAKINGALTAAHASIGALKVNGQIELTNCTIRSSSLVNGSLIAKGTEFEKELSIASQRVTLQSCTLDSLILREVEGFSGTQIIELSEETVVKGPIIVESGNGEVWLASNSKVEGSITGAKVYKK